LLLRLKKIIEESKTTIIKTQRSLARSECNTLSSCYLRLPILIFFGDFGPKGLVTSVVGGKQPQEQMSILLSILHEGINAKPHAREGKSASVTTLILVNCATGSTIEEDECGGKKDLQLAAVTGI
jgi:hypothetical protein